MHRRLLHNGELFLTSANTVSPGQVGFLNGWGVFSTIRVFDGVLFAFERHWARMNKDARLLHVPMPSSAGDFRRDLLRLVEANEAYDATLRVAVVRNRGGFFEGEGITRDFDVIAFTTGIHAWGRGVRLAIQEHGRHGASPFAGAKMTSWAANLTMLENARQQGFDEVVLLDECGRVSECTSANIFAARQGQIVTPPLSSGCLPGVTREILLEECRDLGLVEAHLTPRDLESADEVFITSTTRELLPVLEIQGKPLASGEKARLALQAVFSSHVDRYVAQARLNGHSARHGAAAG